VSQWQVEQVRLRRQSSKQAIALALKGRWREAVAVNKTIVASFPRDVDAHNRLGRAYMELGEYSQAREAYSRALELDPYNTIAKRNLQRLSYLGDSQVGLERDADKAQPQHFIEEVGKAAVVKLYHLAPREILARVAAGDAAYLKIDRSRLVVENKRGEYIGQVGPRYAQRLMRLMQGGNKYTTAVTSATEDTVSVLIREAYQDPSQVGQLSFPPKGLRVPRPFFREKVSKTELENTEEEELEEELEGLLKESPESDDDSFTIKE